MGDSLADARDGWVPGLWEARPVTRGEGAGAGARVESPPLGARDSGDAPPLNAPPPPRCCANSRRAAAPAAVTPLGCGERVAWACEAPPEPEAVEDAADTRGCGCAAAPARETRGVGCSEEGGASVAGEGGREGGGQRVACQA